MPAGRLDGQSSVLSVIASLNKVSLVECNCAPSELPETPAVLEWGGGCEVEVSSKSPISVSPSSSVSNLTVRSTTVSFKARVDWFDLSPGTALEVVWAGTAAVSEADSLKIDADSLANAEAVSTKHWWQR